MRLILTILPIHSQASDSYASFVAETLNVARSNVAVFINKNFSGTLKQRPPTLTRRLSILSMTSGHREQLTTMPSADRSHHIFMPYFGGVDGRVALRLLLQLAENPEITATVVYYSGATAAGQIVVPKTPNSPTNLQRIFSHEDDAAFFNTMQRSVNSEIEPRVLFETASSTDSPAQAALARAQTELGQNPKNAGDIIIVGRNAEWGSSEGSSNSLGIAANTVLQSNVQASVLVVQAKGSGAQV